MKCLLQLALAGLLVTSFTDRVEAQPPKMKMTTEVPPGIATPDKLETRLGTLTLRDGVPDQETAQKVYDNLDFQRGVQAYLDSIQIASMYGMRKGILEFGPANRTALLFETLMDSKALWLTPNTTSIYMTSWLELKDEPMVIETPPNVLGIIDDHWFNYVADFGNAGPDKGRGGKFLILPPGYDGQVPEGYFVARTNTYGNWVIWRGFQENGDTAPAVVTTKKLFRIYPISQKANPPKMNFVNVSGVFNNTIHRMDYGIFEEINEVVQAEPSEGQDPELLGLLASIGIKRGVPFKPNTRMKKILKEAADVGAATVRTLAARPRDDMFYFYPGEGVWSTPFPGGSHEFLDRWRSRAGRPQLLPLLCDGHHAGDDRQDGRQGLAVRRCLCRRPGQGLRRRQDLQGPSAAQRTGQGFLVLHTVRQPDARHAPDRSAVPGSRQQQAGTCRRTPTALLTSISAPSHLQARRAIGSRPSLARAGICCFVSMARCNPGSTRRGGRVILSWWSSRQQQVIQVARWGTRPAVAYNVSSKAQSLSRTVQRSSDSRTQYDESNATSRRYYLLACWPQASAQSPRLKMTTDIPDLDQGSGHGGDIHRHA